MSTPFLLGTDYLRKIQSVRPQNLVSLWPQNEPLGHAVSTEIVRGYDGAYTAVTLGQPGVPGSGLTSAGYDGATSFNDIYTASFANDNGLLNPGFETAGAMPPTWANWVDVVGDGAIANEVVIVHEGTDAAKLTAGVLRTTRETQTYATVPGEVRRLRFWSRSDASAESTRYRLFDVTNGVSIIPTSNTGITGLVWTLFATQYTVPAGCISVRFEAWCSNLAGAVSYFDACEDRRMDGFLGDQGTIIVPAQVANVGVWTDGIARQIIQVGVDGSNYVLMRKTAANNEIQFQYRAGGIVELQVTAGLTNIDFAFYGVTWDIAAGGIGEVRYYIQGVPSGATDTGLGTWVGDLNATIAVIGAASTVPASVWHGNIGPVPYWSDALSPDEMRYLGT